MSGSDGYRNLVNLIAPEPVKGHKAKIYSNTSYTRETNWWIFKAISWKVEDRKQQKSCKLDISWTS